MPKVKLFYTIRNCGDGSAEVDFYADKKTAQLACDIEDEGGEPFSENYPHTIELEFDKNGKLLNPSSTEAELRAELAEKRGETVDDDDDNTTLPKAFKKAALPVPTNPSDLAGKTVVFTGEFSAMTRAEARSIASAFEAVVRNKVSQKTDYLIGGDRMGMLKLGKAQELGTTILSEDQWKHIVNGASGKKNVKKP